MPKNKIKTQVIDTISDVDFLTNKEKKDWLSLVESMNQNQLNETFQYFSKSEQNLEAMKIAAINGAGLKKIFTKGIKKITNKFINKLRKNKN